MNGATSGPAGRAAVIVRRLALPVGRYLLLLGEAFSTPKAFRRYRADFFTQMRRLGLESLPIVALAAAFTGAVTTTQTVYHTKSD